MAEGQAVSKGVRSRPDKVPTLPRALEEDTLCTEGLARRERAILFLSSSKILTPHPPLRPASVYPPPLLRGEDRLAGRRGGWGFYILEDERNRIALLQ